MGAFLQGLVILGLVLEDQAFHWNVGEQRIPVCQNQALPQPPHAAIAVGKGVDELKFVVKDGAFDKNMVWRGLYPAKQR